VTLAPGAIEASAEICALVFEQSGERGSVTFTFVSVTLPLFVTTIVKFAVPPLEIVCDFGFFVIEMAGFCGLDGGGGFDTQCLSASELFTWPGALVPVARDIVTPPTVSEVAARTASSPAVVETSVAEQEPPIVVHVVADVNEPTCEPWNENVTGVPFGAAT
jgi:hypothetical protein